LSDELSTAILRRVRYPLTNLVDGQLIAPDLAAELGDLAAKFRRSDCEEAKKPRSA